MSVPKQDRPDLAVVLCVHNGRRWLTQAVESILSQSFPHFRFIVVDDGSTDGSGELVRSYRDPRIELIRQDRQGPGGARNTGMRATDTEFVAFMDADDISEKTRLAVQRAFLVAHPDVAAVGCSTRIMDQTGRPVFTQHVPTGSAWCRRRILQEKFYSYGSSLMVRRRPAIDVGLFRSFFRQREDVDFMLRMAQKYRIDNVPDVLYRYRMNMEGASHRDPRPGVYYHRIAYELARERSDNGCDRLQRGVAIQPYKANGRPQPRLGSIDDILYHLHFAEAQLLREQGQTHAAFRHVVKAWTFDPLSRRTLRQAMKLLQTRPDRSDSE